MNKPELCAIFRATPEAIAELLELPPGAYIDFVRSEEELGVLSFRIRGAGWPTRIGALIQQARPTISRRFLEDGTEMKRTISWGFPEVDQQ